MSDIKFRQDSDDSGIWDAIYTHNDYALEDDLTGKVVLDIGAHVGSFSALALNRNAESVWAFEPDLSAFECLIHNVPDAKAYPVAVWRSDLPVRFLTLCRPNNRTYGGNSIAFKIGDDLRRTVGIPIDFVIEHILSEMDVQHIDIMKLDCEGGEFPILLTCTNLHVINQIIYEWHHFGSVIPEARVNGVEQYTKDHLLNHLHNFGFKSVSLQDHGHLGIFKATRCLT